MQIKAVPRVLKYAFAVLGIILIVKAGCHWLEPGGKVPLRILRSVNVKRGDLMLKINATGTVKPQNRVEIKPPIAGRIEEVLVSEGEQVKAGQILAQMSSTERAALLDAARAQGGKVLERWENAYKPAPLLAPLDGTVIVRAVEPGQTVTTSDPVVVLSDRLIVEAQVDETDLAEVKLGQDVEVRLDAYPDKMIPAKVVHISYESTLVNNVNVYAIDIYSDSVPEMFRSGMTADVTFIVANLKNVLLIPAEAVNEWPSYAKKPEGIRFAAYTRSFTGNPVPVPVKIGASDGRMTEILSGLKEGETILVVRRKEAAVQGSPFSPFGGSRKRA
ncbi:MAG TPA: efflux RND transporter periplasmic adaptor subunit [Candidatus Omnitrophota bacterium]|nr:efflux RND transporter periplasmic adaptor subunit [Candidatus Omnitrophota bacterium]